MTSDVRDEILSRSMYMCEFIGCTNRATEVAHRIAKTQENIAMVKRIVVEQYGMDLTRKEVVDSIIDNPINCAASCRGHNDYFNAGYKPLVVEAIIRECMEEVYGKTTGGRDSM